MVEIGSQLCFQEEGMPNLNLKGKKNLALYRTVKQIIKTEVKKKEDLECQLLSMESGRQA